MCVKERESEREKKTERQRETEWGCFITLVSKCVLVNDYVHLCVCVCVYERVRETVYFK